MKITFSENMYGTYRQPKAKGLEGKFNFNCKVEIPSVVEFLLNQLSYIEGTVEMEGVVGSAPLKGTLLIDPVFRRELVYDFDFNGEEGKSYHFFGKKQIQYLNLISSMTHLKGKILKEGEVFADADLHFHLLETPSLLLSLRVML